MSDQPYVLVSAPTKAGETFMLLLKQKGVSFAALTNNELELKRLKKLGIRQILSVDTKDHGSWSLPEFPIGKVFLFENSLPLCCRYIQICRSWTENPIYVITGKSSSRMIYKTLGVDRIIHSQSRDLVGLLD